MQYLEQLPKSALQRVKGMPFEWSLNPYRGCRHACLYCYARIYHSYLGYADPGDFDRVVLHKKGLADRLRRELRTHRTAVDGEIAIGTATDPYQPLEARERVTRSLLEVLLDAGRAVSITTKSPLVTRDLDLLRSFASYGGVRVNMTVTVLDEGLWRLLEPMTPHPDGRLAALRTLADAGIPTAVFLAPILPGLGETQALRVLERTASAGARHVMLQLLRMSPGVREWLLPHLANARPDAARHLAALYGSRDVVAAPDRGRILAPIRALRRRLGLERAAEPLRVREEQMPLFGAVIDSTRGGG